MNARTNRLIREIELLRNDPPPGVAAWPISEENVCQFQAHIQGPHGTPYADGVFLLELEVSERYPFEPPKVRFVTPIFHPNIDDRGRICLDTLKPQPQGSWTPSINIPTLLTTIRLLMVHPNADDGLMPEVTEVFKRDLSTFERLAREHTTKHALHGVFTVRSELSDDNSNMGGQQEEEEDDEDSMVIAKKDGIIIDGPAGSGGLVSTSNSSSCCDEEEGETMIMQQQVHEGKGGGGGIEEMQDCAKAMEDEEEDRVWDSDVSICGEESYDEESEEEEDEGEEEELDGGGAGMMRDEDGGGGSSRGSHQHYHRGEGGRKGGGQMVRDDKLMFVATMDGMPPTKRARTTTMG